MTALEDRFWSKVDLSGEGCWEWLAYRDQSGYGRLNIGHEPRGAHRIAWELTHGSIGPGLHVCHHCDNPPCVRPEHLFLGTPKDNSDDKLRKGRDVPPPVRRGAVHHLVSASDVTVRMVREEFAAGLGTTYEIAARHNLSQRTVMAWIHGRSRLLAGGPVQDPDPNWRRKLPQNQPRRSA